MKKISFIAAMALLVLGLSLTQSCKKDDNDGMAEKTLYDTLGGTTMVADPSHSGAMIEQGRLGIRSVVDSTIFVIAADPQLNGFFTVLLSEVTSGNTSGLQELSTNLTDFFCVATGSKNYTYSGLSMVAAHDPAQNSRMNGKANNANFDRFVADLVTGAQQVGVSTPVIGQVGAVVETVRTQVVQQ